MASNLFNVSENIDFYLELSPSEETRNTGSTQFNEDGSPFDYSSTLQRKLRRNPFNPLLWRFKTTCLDYEYYFQ
jgi:hypothetical protein